MNIRQCLSATLAALSTSALLRSAPVSAQPIELQCYDAKKGKRLSGKPTESDHRFSYDITPQPKGNIRANKPTILFKDLYLGVTNIQIGSVDKNAAFKPKDIRSLSSDYEKVSQICAFGNAAINTLGNGQKGNVVFTIPLFGSTSNINDIRFEKSRN
jgi:hypothetical protein